MGAAISKADIKDMDEKFKANPKQSEEQADSNKKKLDNGEVKAEDILKVEFGAKSSS